MMPQTLKVLFTILVLWQSVYIFSAGVWEIKRKNRAGGAVCFIVVPAMLAALTAALAN